MGPSIGYRRAVVLFAAVAAIACGADQGTAPPPATARLEIVSSSDSGFSGDEITVSAVVRTAQGDIVPGAPVEWTVDNPSRAEYEGNGVFSLLAPGAVTITGRSGVFAASHTLLVMRLSVLSVAVGSGVIQLHPGDVTPFGIAVLGEGGRYLTGRTVTLASDDSSIATLDASGRLRAVRAGVTTLRATADGVTGIARVEVDSLDATLVLSTLGGVSLPVLIYSDSVSWNGERELHEGWLEGGEIVLSGGPTPRYVIRLRYAQYEVRSVGGQRVLTLRARWGDFDRGVVSYDVRGDLQMVSEYIYPLSHSAFPVSGGLQFRYHIPGDDEVLDLLFRREPL